MESPWKPDELAFIAEEETMIKITPNFSSGTIKLLSRECGPFTAQKPVKVPLWLAFFLYSKKACVLVAPKWLRFTSRLNHFLEREKASKDLLTELPKFFFEISFSFFNNARELIQDSDTARATVEQIWEIRNEKLRSSIISTVGGLYDNFDFPNATRMEIHLFRYPISKVSELLLNLYSFAHPPIENEDEEF